MKHQAAILAAVAAVTTTAGMTAVDLRDFEGPVDILLHHAATTGSSTPTVTIKLQHSDDNSAFSDVTGGGFTAITATAGLQRKEVQSDGLKRYVRLRSTVSGTTPSAILGCVVVGSKKYGNA